MITDVNQHYFLIKPGRRNSACHGVDSILVYNIPASIKNRPLILENKI
jgi:hypothetical protein